MRCAVCPVCDACIGRFRCRGFCVYTEAIGSAAVCAFYWLHRPINLSLFATNGTRQTSNDKHRNDRRQPCVVFNSLVSVDVVFSVCFLLAIWCCWPNISIFYILYRIYIYFIIILLVVGRSTENKRGSTKIRQWKLINHLLANRKTKIYIVVAMKGESDMRFYLFTHIDFIIMIGRMMLLSLTLDIVVQPLMDMGWACPTNASLLRSPQKCRADASSVYGIRAPTSISRLIGNGIKYLSMLALFFGAKHSYISLFFRFAGALWEIQTKKSIPLPLLMPRH